jgi:type VI secretion system protein ImpF
MAELTPAERLQPCLLDRLTDEHPETVKESRDLRVVSLRRYRAAVLRDLDWLLNTPAPALQEDLEDLPHVASSVLNYGTPDLSGTTVSALSPEEYERGLVTALKRFEPRIFPQGLKIRAITSDQMDRKALSMEISGELWAQPLPDPLYVRTDVDLETGQCVLKDRPNG